MYYWPRFCFGKTALWVFVFATALEYLGMCTLITKPVVRRDEKASSEAQDESSYKNSYISFRGKFVTFGKSTQKLQLVVKKGIQKHFFDLPTPVMALKLRWFSRKNNQTNEQSVGKRGLS